MTRSCITHHIFTPNPRIANVVRERALHESGSINELLNHILEEALFADEKPSVEKPPFQVQAFDLRLKNGIEPTKLRDLLTELEVEER